MTQVSLIGDRVEVNGVPVATLRSDAPPTVRDAFREALRSEIFEQHMAGVVADRCLLLDDEATPAAHVGPVVAQISGSLSLIAKAYLAGARAASEYLTGNAPVPNVVEYVETLNIELVDIAIRVVPGARPTSDPR